MQLNSKIILAACVFAVIGLSYWGYPVVKNRYFSQDKIETVLPLPPTENIPDILADPETVPEPSAEEAPVEEEIAPENPAAEAEKKAAEAEPLLDVTTGDCANQCRDYKNDEEDFKYCQNFCGLDASKKSTDGCDQLEDLEKDYCWKDLAVAKKDLPVCDKIIDSGIKKTCRNRVAEDLLDEQNAELE